MILHRYKYILVSLCIAILSVLSCNKISIAVESRETKSVKYKIVNNKVTFNSNSKIEQKAEFCKIKRAPEEAKQKKFKEKWITGVLKFKDIGPWNTKDPDDYKAYWTGKKNKKECIIHIWLKLKGFENEDVDPEKLKLTYYNTDHDPSQERYKIIGSDKKYYKYFKILYKLKELSVKAINIHYSTSHDPSMRLVITAKLTDKKKKTSMKAESKERPKRPERPEIIEKGEIIVGIEGIDYLSENKAKHWIECRNNDGTIFTMKETSVRQRIKIGDIKEPLKVFLVSNAGSIEFKRDNTYFFIDLKNHFKTGSIVLADKNSEEKMTKEVCLKIYTRKNDNSEIILYSKMRNPDNSGKIEYSFIDWGYSYDSLFVEISSISSDIFTSHLINTLNESVEIGFSVIKEFHFRVNGEKIAPGSSILLLSGGKNMDSQDDSNINHPIILSIIPVDKAKTYKTGLYDINDKGIYYQWVSSGLFLREPKEIEKGMATRNNPIVINAIRDKYKTNELRKINGGIAFDRLVSNIDFETEVSIQNKKTKKVYWRRIATGKETGYNFYYPVNAKLTDLSVNVTPLINYSSASASLNESHLTRIELTPVSLPIPFTLAVDNCFIEDKTIGKLEIEKNNKSTMVISGDTDFLPLETKEILEYYDDFSRTKGCSYKLRQGIFPYPVSNNDIQIHLSAEKNIPLKIKYKNKKWPEMPEVQFLSDSRGLIIKNDNTFSLKLECGKNIFIDYSMEENRFYKSIKGSGIFSASNFEKELIIELAPKQEKNYLLINICGTTEHTGKMLDHLVEILKEKWPKCKEVLELRDGDIHRIPNEKDLILYHEDCSGSYGISMPRIFEFIDPDYPAHLIMAVSNKRAGFLLLNPDGVIEFFDANSEKYKNVQFSLLVTNNYLDGNIINEFGNKPNTKKVLINNGTLKNCPNEKEDILRLLQEFGLY